MKKSLIIFAFLIVFFNCNEMLSRTWRQLKIDSPGKLNGICFPFNNDIGFIVGDSGVYKTIDGGESFFKLTIFQNPTMK